MMTIDKTALKKHFDSARPNDMLVITVSALEKDGIKRVKSELEKFMSKNGDYVVTVVRR